ncbi:MAG: phosphoribosylformylglycinamidine synthase [Treponema sp.]|jgi:phosphoribosylformylglycinamidine synthase|nr:phosphoribosylformylglycinamidine synthase [Treponema sp.]
MAVYRVYVEKKEGCDIEARRLKQDIAEFLGINALSALRLINRYDVEGVSREVFERCKTTIFSEPPVDNVYDRLPDARDRRVSAYRVFAVEMLPGQYDQRADSAAQCIQAVTQTERPLVRSAKVYLLYGALSDEELRVIKKYIINPVESFEASLDERSSLALEYDAPGPAAVVSGFRALDDAGLEAFCSRYALAMDAEDLKLCRDYFVSQGRDPWITEIRLIDTYWSDHCRHTTFSTIIDAVEFEASEASGAYTRYLDIRRELNRDDRPITLMDMATIGAKYLKAKGRLSCLDESEEINACSVKIPVSVGGRQEEWLLMFKNETHNHPTEIEPFGGAATCIGGAIRDPLAGRSYVYQAMRISGAANPLAGREATIPGKLPQRKIVTAAAAGYSAYGNQIGLATGLVREIYHPGYAAKHLELGAVIGAAPADHVRRKRPEAGDVVVLVGGRTGRDGIGGASGSSKAHTASSLEQCGAEVQKGNAPEERKLQRLFRDKKTASLIKRCNDFGAGGVSVAVGELAPGLDIDLDKVPKKYEGLDGTELAISESQERMAVVLAPEDSEAFMRAAKAENLEAAEIARVTGGKKLRMRWNGAVIVDIDREFLDANGAEKHVSVLVSRPAGPEAPPHVPPASFAGRFEQMAVDLNICSQQGLCERFDSTIGGGTVLMPFGGRFQATPAQVMAALLPVKDEDTETVSLMAFGFDPFMMERDPFRGAYLAVVESAAKIIAGGGTLKQCWLSFQEYFERLEKDSRRWGKPVAALLGALEAQLDLGVAAIGGKDSMSGSFHDLHVPPTLVSFAVSVTGASGVISGELKKPGSKLVFLGPQKAEEKENAGDLRRRFDMAETLIKQKKVLSAWAVGAGGIAEALFKMALGNRIGVHLDAALSADELFVSRWGGFVFELAGDERIGVPLGKTAAEFMLDLRGERLDLALLQEKYESTLQAVYPFPSKNAAPAVVEDVPALSWNFSPVKRPPDYRNGKPPVFVPVFPGTNCEYDTEYALKRAGAEPFPLVIRNLSAQDVAESIQEAEKLLRRSRIMVIPGGFSGGDEPDGSGKFITAFFRNPRLAGAIMDLLENRDGLILGICNGFQALIKLGLVPYGTIMDSAVDGPTLTYNRIGRHQSMLVRTRVASNKSPWLMGSGVGDIHTLPISHGEGRFTAREADLRRFIADGQIAAQYVDLQGKPTMDPRYNPNGSLYAVEALSSPDGRVLGKMGHSERRRRYCYQNVPGSFDQRLFENAVAYFH